MAFSLAFLSTAWHPIQGTHTHHPIYPIPPPPFLSMNREEPEKGGVIMGTGEGPQPDKTTLSRLNVNKSLLSVCSGRCPKGLCPAHTLCGHNWADLFLSVKTYV